MENHIFAFSINSLKTNRPKQSFLKATDLHYPLLDATYTASSATSTNTHSCCLLVRLQLKKIISKQAESGASRNMTSDGCVILSQQALKF